MYEDSNDSSVEATFPTHDANPEEAFTLKKSQVGDGPNNPSESNRTSETNRTY